MAFLLKALGLALRETGQALDRVGCVVASSAAYKEPCARQRCPGALPGGWQALKPHRARAVYRHRAVMPVGTSSPTVQAGGYIAPSASVSGDVTVSPGASVWYGAIVRSAPHAGHLQACRAALAQLHAHAGRERLSGGMPAP